MHVPVTTLGSTPIRIGSIGLGCMSMTAAYQLGSRDNDESVATIRRALDLGVTYLDTGDSYGFNNELLLGRALKGRRAQAFVAGKVGLVGRVDGQYRINATPSHIRRSIDETLHRLRSDYLDVYQLQAVDPAVPVLESWGAMAELVREGKVRTLGVVTDDTSLLDQLQGEFPTTVVTAQLSLWEPSRRGMATWAQAHGMTLTASAPLGRGYLTGTIPPSHAFDSTDVRSHLPGFDAKTLRARRPLVELLQSLARRTASTPAQVALAWVAAQGSTTLPIPGARRVSHMEENSAAAELHLPQDLLADLDEAVAAAEAHT